MTTNIKWHEAFELMAKGEECEVHYSGSYSTMRIQGSELQYRLNGGTWLQDDTSSHEYWQKAEWRRVPKTPRVHELAAKWRAGGNSTQSVCASQLEAALREDEMVSLKGLTLEDLNQVNVGGFRGTQAVLGYLRSKAVKL